MEVVVVNAFKNKRFCKFCFQTTTVHDGSVEKKLCLFKGSRPCPDDAAFVQKNIAARQKNKKNHVTISDDINFLFLRRRGAFPESDFSRHFFGFEKKFRNSLKKAIFAKLVFLSSSSF